MEIIKKEVEFNGDTILTVEKEGKIYVGIAYICNSLNMTEGQKKRQILKVQEDETLKLGVKKLGINFDTQVREQVFIELDFLSGWLFKINPARFDEELKKKLLEYQLHCKDVLADYFIGERKDININETIEPEAKEIIKRGYRIKEKKDEIRKLLIEIASDYNWIKFRAETGFEKTKFQFRETLKKFFILDGKELSLKDIDNLNPEQLKTILKRLKEE